MGSVEIVVNESTFSTLIAGLYATSHNTNILAIPSYFWLMISDAIIPYMKNWMYDVQSFEDWINNYLLITAKEVCTPKEIEDFKKNTIYIEALNGNMVLIATGDIIWENSTGT